MIANTWPTLAVPCRAAVPDLTFSKSAKVLGKSGQKSRAPELLGAGGDDAGHQSIPDAEERPVVLHSALALDRLVCDRVELLCQRIVRSAAVQQGLQQVLLITRLRSIRGCQN